MTRPTLPIRFAIDDLLQAWRAFAQQRRRASAEAETVRIARRSA